MLSGIIKSVGLGATIQTAELDNDSVTSAKIADLDADLTLGAGVNLIFATSTGTQIGEATNQLLGFYGTTPVDQPATVSDPDQSGDAAADVAANAAAIGAIIDRLQELGLIA